MTAAELIPPRPSLARLRAAAADCTACPLHARATQTVRVSRQRGRFVKSPLAPRVLATVHPSSLLRARDAQIARFIADPRKAAQALAA